MSSPDWLQAALADPQVTDLCMNGWQEAFADRGRGLEALRKPEPLWRSEEELRLWVLGQLSHAGKSWDARHPFVDATLESGHRIHVTFPPMSRKGILVSMRRLPGAERAQGRRGSERWAGSPLWTPLREAVMRGESVVVVGATGSGKTTLVNDLLTDVDAAERIVALEDTPELAPLHPHFLSLVSRPPNADGCGEVTLRALFKQTLRMRPDRIILGECRGGEVLELLQALNSGHRGALATLHANSPREGLRRIELLCMLASGGSIPLTAIRELLALGIQWIAQVRRFESQRKITELWRVEGREGDTILMRPVIQQGT